MTHGSTFLGDALYARWDAYGCLVLFTTNGIRITNTVVLEPEVLDALRAFIRTSPALADECAKEEEDRD
jgi:hypothetical protein